MPKYDLSDTTKYPLNAGVLALKPEPNERATLGELIIRLALGLQSIPENATAAQKKKILADADVNVPEGVGVEFVYRQPNTLVVMIPPKDMVVAALRRYQEKDKKNEKYVDLPKEYADMISGAWTKSIEEFYEIRVSDYTLSYCR